MAWLDALLGRLFSTGVELELLGGINFIGFTITPDLENNRYNISVAGGGSAHIIATDDTPLTARNTLNFAPEFVVTDDSGNDQTDISIATAGISKAKISDSVGLSVLGRSANSAGVLADIVAGTDAHVLRRSGTSLAFGTLTTASYADSSVTVAKLNINATLQVGNNDITGVKNIGYNGILTHISNMGTTETFDFSDGGFHAAIADDDCTLTFTWPGMVTTTTIKITQDGTGGHVLTFPAAVKNGAAIAADLDTTAGTYSLISFLWESSSACTATINATGITP